MRGVWSHTDRVLTQNLSGNFTVSRTHLSLVIFDQLFAWLASRPATPCPPPPLWESSSESGKVTSLLKSMTSWTSASILSAQLVEGSGLLSLVLLGVLGRLPPPPPPPPPRAENNRRPSDKFRTKLLFDRSNLLFVQA